MSRDQEDNEKMESSEKYEGRKTDLKKTVLWYLMKEFNLEIKHKSTGIPCGFFPCFLCESKTMNTKGKE